MGSESYIFLGCLFFIFLLVPFIIPLNKWFIMFSFIFHIISIIVMFRLVMLATFNQFTYTTMLAIITFMTCIFPFSLSLLSRFSYTYYQKKINKRSASPDNIIIIVSSFLAVFSFCCGFILTSFLFK